MGTNYYLHTKAPCKTCGRPFEAKHIGKSSAGWCFSLHVIPDEGINDLPDWEKLWKKKGAFILDEYGDRVSTGMMKKIITERAWKGGEQWSQDEHTYNHSISGPNGLARHRLGDGFCIKHGAGTWDCLIGEFS
jgi:hypothetical protein